MSVHGNASGVDPTYRHSPKRSTPGEPLEPPAWVRYLSSAQRRGSGGLVARHALRSGATGAARLSR